MELGAFSISLAVKDLAASRTFYETFGFTAFGGNGTNWLIMKNGPHLIGLFQGMFEKNILTFNPGWDQDAKAVDGFTDVRELQRRTDEQLHALHPARRMAGERRLSREPSSPNSDASCSVMAPASSSASTMVTARR